MVETEEELKSLVDKGDRGEREKKKKITYNSTFTKQRSWSLVLLLYRK